MNILFWNRFFLVSWLAWDRNIILFFYFFLWSNINGFFSVGLNFHIVTINCDERVWKLIPLAKWWLLLVDIKFNLNVLFIRRNNTRKVKQRRLFDEYKNKQHGHNKAHKHIRKALKVMRLIVVWTKPKIKMQHWLTCWKAVCTFYRVVKRHESKPNWPSAQTNRAHTFPSAACGLFGCENAINLLLNSNGRQAHKSSRILAASCAPNSWKSQFFVVNKQ